ncbi:hypothetical protein SAMN05216338_1018133 [Bradyrhizobium sp. Rc2d]|nr:hypothetical protein SAMN05216338_1018133 [Bradyrhizobium sp. Rc2d]
MPLRSRSLNGCIKDSAALRAELTSLSSHAIPDLGAVGNIGGAKPKGVPHAGLPLDGLARSGLGKGRCDRCTQQSKNKTKLHGGLSLSGWTFGEAGDVIQRHCGR